MSFNAIVDGPVMSRRVGRVVQLNLWKTRDAVRNVACAGCRNAVPAAASDNDWWREDELFSAVHAVLSADHRVECIAISGRIDPTLHPRFASFVDGLCRIRARRAPGLKLAVVSNGSTPDRAEVRRALARCDMRLETLDARDVTSSPTGEGAHLPIRPRFVRHHAPPVGSASSAAHTG